jgi:hypothetical protein
MFRLRFLTPLLIVPVLSVALAMVGCSGSETKTPPSTGGPKKADRMKGPEKPSEGGGTAKTGAKTALKSTGFATIKGKITYDGTPPPPADIRIPDDNKDKQYCLQGPHTDPTWIVSDSKGVKNVVLWVRPPADKYFEIPADQQKPVEPIIKIDQPFCVFEPHVAVTFPTFYDGKTQQRTGQKLVVANSAKITHNTNWSPARTNLDTGDNVILEPGKPPREIPLFESPIAKGRSGLEDLLTLKCNIHQWMTGYIWAFDHPYAAITKDDGTFEIKNVPAGAELQLVGWHEAGNYFLPGGQKGETIGPLKENETKELDFKINK